MLLPKLIITSLLITPIFLLVIKYFASRWVLNKTEDLICRIFCLLFLLNTIFLVGSILYMIWTS